MMNRGPDRFRPALRICLICILLTGLFPAFSLPGDAAPGERANIPGAYKGQVTFFLNGPDRVSLDITFHLLSVTLKAEDGTAYELLDSPLTINSVKIIGRQLLLGEKDIPEGKYRGVRLIVKDASVMRKSTRIDLALPDKNIDAKIDTTVHKKQSTSLFMSWNPDTSISEGHTFRPAFSIRGALPELSSLLVYVTNEDSNNVSAINRQTGQTVATIMVGRKPRGIAISLRRDNQRIYVANSGSNSISVIDPAINRVENEIPIRLGWEPEDLAVNSSPGDRESLFIANFRSNTVSVVDTTTFQETEKIPVGNGPIAIAVDPPVDNLFGTRFLSPEDINSIRSFRDQYFNVYVVNRNSNDISILKMERATNRFKESSTFDVEWDPVSLEVDYQRGKVFVSNYNSDKLSVIDILEVIRGSEAGSASTINNVGTSITGVVSDPVFNRMYLLRETTGQIMVIRPFADRSGFIQTELPPILGRIAVGKSPRAMELDPEARRLYVVNRGGNTISVINKITKRQEQVIPVGKKPYGIAVFPD
jgi:YVTN family beta-propeller protein